MLRFHLVLLAVAGLLLGCGDDASPVRAVCRANGVRLAVDGEVGSTTFSIDRASPEGGRLGDTFLTAGLEGGDGGHVLAFTTNTPLDVDLWTAILQRLNGGANDAGRLEVATRTGTIPCDPRDGQLCATYGVDANGDGILLGSSEVIYPVDSGEVVFTELTGNTVAGDFDLTFGPATSGSEPDSEQGGRLQGCFYLYRTADRRTLF